MPQEITAELQRSPFLTVVAGDTTDASNREQVTLITCQVTEHLHVHEEFLGLYGVPSIDALTLTSVITDIFTE